MVEFASEGANPLDTVFPQTSMNRIPLGSEFHAYTRFPANRLGYVAVITRSVIGKSTIMFDTLDPPARDVVITSSFTVIVIVFEITFEVSGVPNPRIL
jgi:hypothetical protein